MESIQRGEAVSKKHLEGNGTHLKRTSQTYSLLDRIGGKKTPIGAKGGN